MAESAVEDCTYANPALVQAYIDALDAWVSVSHLRFGPSEQDDRALALAFWPNPRGSTPKGLSAFMGAEDPAVAGPDEFATVSVAARGLYALEYLLFDPQVSSTENPAYRCSLIQAVTNNISSNAEAILAGWQGG